MRWPEHLVLRSSAGEIVRGRCRSTNRCAYCARMFAWETAELLSLDAAADAPTCWLVLTTRTATLDVKRFWRGLERTMRAVRRRWPAAEYVCIVEFTTGYGARSGGRRRPHWNVLLKGVPVGDVAELRAVTLAVWCGQVDAEPRGQWIDTVYETGGLTLYLALHFLKESQAPPDGWAGHRFRRSRGYFSRPMPELRAEARRSLKLRRETYRLAQLGHDAATVHELTTAGLAAADLLTWELVVLNPSTEPPRPNRAHEVWIRARADVNPAQRALAPPPAERAGLPGRRRGRAEGPLSGLTSNLPGAPLPARLFDVPAATLRHALRARRRRPDVCPDG